MLKIQALAAAMFCTTALADNNSLNLQLPSGPTSYQSDSFRAGDLDCKNAIGGATNFEIGVTGIINNAVSPFSGADAENPMTKDVGMFARIVIPLDAPRDRINCNDLYRLELRKRTLEVMKLEQELKNLKQLQFEGQK